MRRALLALTATCLQPSVAAAPSMTSDSPSWETRTGGVREDLLRKDLGGNRRVWSRLCD